jgi:F-type H+-transporting ATPase subunit a
MIALIGLLPLYTLWAPNIIWKLFDMFIGAIQAFIFALLTILYFGAAAPHDESHEEGHDEGHEETAEPEEDREPEPAGEPQLESAHR